MKFLVLLLAVAPMYVAGDVFSDLSGQKLQYITVGPIREKRQKHNPLPPAVQQLLQSQTASPPLVPVPRQPIPKLGPATPAQSSYRPQVITGGGVQQPNYKTGPQNLPQQPQYRPLPANYPQQAVQPNYNVQQPLYPSKLPPQVQQALNLQRNFAVRH